MGLELRVSSRKLNIFRRKHGATSAPAEQIPGRCQFLTGQRDFIFQISYFKLFLTALLSSAFLILSFPRFNIFPLAWIALVPWLVVLPRLTFRQALLGSVLFGSTFFAGLVHWVSLFGIAPWLLTSLYQGIFIACACLFIWFFRNTSPMWRSLGMAGAWTFIDWLRGQGSFGFTWGWLGYSQASWLDFIQIVSIAGVPALTFLIVLHNAILSESICAIWQSDNPSITPKFGLQRRLSRFIPLLATWLLIAVIALSGHFAITYPIQPPERLKLAILQMTTRTPSAVDVTREWTEESTRADSLVLTTLINRAATQHPDVIIAPESALPGILNRSPSLTLTAQNAAVSSNAWLLVGSHSEDTPLIYHNSAYLFSPKGSLADRYNKVHLVPFGEYVPGRHWLPGIEYYPVSSSDLTPGASIRPLQADKARIGVNICFESTFPSLTRKLVQQNANIIAVITNDGWFLKSAAAAQHKQMAVFRAVESHRWVARSALTGISCLISPQGRVSQELGIYKRGVIWGEAGLEEGQTPYIRLGEWFVILSGLLAITAAVSAKIRILKSMEK